MKSEIERMRMRMHRMASVKADLITAGVMKGRALESRVFLSISDHEGGTAVCAVPDTSISDLARATLQLAQLINAEGEDGKRLPRVTSITDVTQWVEGAPEGQVALELSIGGASVALMFDRAQLQSAMLAGLLAARQKAQ